MATYQILIDDIREELDDYTKTQLDKADGDGSTTKFILSKENIEDDSYVVRISAAVKVEGTHYNIDKKAGEVTFTSGNAPIAGNDNVEFGYSYSNIRSIQYLKWLNDSIQRYRKKLWTEFVDETTITSTAYEEEIDLSGISENIIRLVDIWVKNAVDAGETVSWITLTTAFEPRYIRALNKLQISPQFTVTGYPMKFRGLKSFTLGTAVTDTFDPPDRFFDVYKISVQAKYYQRLATRKVKELAAAGTEAAAESSRELRLLAKDLSKSADEEANRVKYTTPAIRIPVIKKSSIRRVI